MIKVLKLKTIIKIVIILIAVIILVTAIFKVIAYNKNESKEEYKILVDVEDSKLYLFKNGEVIEEYKCSGGKKSTPSPIGTWKITFKAKWGEGFGRTLYGNKCPVG